MTRRSGSGIPTFAIVGAVNHGKSSVVAALAEDDDIRISSMPGETVAVQRFELRELFVFIDTPGFQNARKALAAIESIAANTGVDTVPRVAAIASAQPDAPVTTASTSARDDPLHAFRVFVERHHGDAEFDAECRLLQPVVDGAGIVYVVDGSRPLRDIHRCEMEIIRRTGAPRLAIINRVGEDDHVDAWRGHLDQHFNLVREFDAHDATYADRKDLIESLASIERGWKERLREAVALLDADRRRRRTDTAAVIAASVVDCLRHTETDRVDAATPVEARSERGAALERRYTAAIARREHATHAAIIALHAHRRVSPDTVPAALFDSDLFADETWRAFGLDTGQLVRLSTVAGGLAGAGVDAAVLGHSLGLGAVVGAAAGAGGAWAVGKRRPELTAHWPTARLPAAVRAWLPRDVRMAGRTVVVGPYRAGNFPWILIDRALCVFAYAATRSHARRDDDIVSTGTLLPVLDALGLTVAHWPETDRDACRRVLAAASRGTVIAPEAVATLERTIDAGLARITDAERPIASRLRPAPTGADHGHRP